MEKLNYEEFVTLLMEELDKRYPDMKKTVKESSDSIKEEELEKTETMHEVYETETTCSVFQYAGINENTTIHIQTVEEKQILLS